MMFYVAKSTSINLRITPEFRAELETLAAYHGLSMSSYAHSILVKGVRRERQELNDVLPIASQSERRVNRKVPAPVVARIEPGQMSKREIQRSLENQDELKPRRTTKIPVGGKAR
jgi:plasmid stability protein